MAKEDFFMYYSIAADDEWMKLAQFNTGNRQGHTRNGY